LNLKVLLRSGPALLAAVLFEAALELGQLSFDGLDDGVVLRVVPRPLLVLLDVGREFGDLLGEGIVGEVEGVAVVLEVGDAFS
jgi:hypothetical protein